MSHPLTEALRCWGCDTADALARLGDDEDLYIELIRTMPEEIRLDALDAALAAGDAKAAFVIAHDLKGMLPSLGLTPLCEPVYVLTELLRKGSCLGCGEAMADLVAQKSILTEIIKDNE